MRNLCISLLILWIAFQVKCAPREPRWIPYRYSDYDYGLDTSSQSTKADHSKSYLGYFWPEYSEGSYDEEDYSGLYYRAGSGNTPEPGHPVDPVHMLQQAQAYSYEQALQSMYPQYPYMYPPQYSQYPQYPQYSQYPEYPTQRGGPPAMYPSAPYGTSVPPPPPLPPAPYPAPSVEGRASEGPVNPNFASDMFSKGFQNIQMKMNPFLKEFLQSNAAVEAAGKSLANEEIKQESANVAVDPTGAVNEETNSETEDVSPVDATEPEAVVNPVVAAEPEAVVNPVVAAEPEAVENLADATEMGAVTETEEQQPVATEIETIVESPAPLKSFTGDIKETKTETTEERTEKEMGIMKFTEESETEVKEIGTEEDIQKFMGLVVEGRSMSDPASDPMHPGSYPDPEISSPLDLVYPGVTVPIYAKPPSPVRIPYKYKYMGRQYPPSYPRGPLGPPPTPMSPDYYGSYDSYPSYENVPQRYRPSPPPQYPPPPYVASYERTTRNSFAPTTIYGQPKATPVAFSG